MITKDMAETAAIWFGFSVFFTVFTLAPKPAEYIKEAGGVTALLGALIAAICAAFALWNLLTPPGS
jgi:hypothetical protein